MTGSEKTRPNTHSPQESKAARPRRRAGARAWRVLVLGFAIVAVAGIIGPMLWGETEGGGGRSSTLAVSTAESRVARVDVVRPVRGGVKRLTIQPGTVHAFESVDLYAKASGFLKTQAADIGTPIKSGQTLAEINAPELLVDVEESSAAVEQARAKAEQMVSRVATAEAERTAVSAAVAQAEADVARLASKRSLGGKQYERIKDLYAQKAVDGKLVDEHLNELETAQAAERTGQAAVLTARAQAAAAAARVHEAQADTAEARAAIRVAEARLAQSKVMADYSRIVAPFDGVVTRRTFHPGAFIRSAADGTSEPLLRVTRTDLMRVVVQVPDLDVPLLDVGDKATFEVDALKGREYAGTVARLGKSEDPATRTMRVELDLPNPDGRLVEGMYGRATIELQPPTENLTVPAACVVGHAARGSAAVFVIRDGKARKTSVTLGADDGTSVEVLSGLAADDEVVVRPGTSLDDGTPVLASKAPTGKVARH